MTEYKCTIDGHPVNSMRIGVSDTFDKPRCQEQLNRVMVKLKEQGLTHSLVVTIFDTNNRQNEFRSESFVDIGKQKCLQHHYILIIIHKPKERTT